jgi:acetylornithine deacetylase/succinyl-diaminopimelate desuccinylase-like protein
MYIQTAYEWIAAHEAEILDELHRFCAQPSISAEGRGMDTMAVLVAEALARRGFHTELVAMPGGFPVIFGESTDPVPDGAPTLLIYNHYDVQPEGDETLWSVPAFGATVRDDKILGRGVADTKGHIVSRLAAIDAMRAARGSLPIKIKWVIEGEEEVGSTNLDKFLLQYRERLGADGCLWEYGTYNWDGTPQIMLGMKGMLTVELRAGGPNRDLHSAMAAYVASPVWRLIWALDSIKDENENIRIKGFYDAIDPADATEIDMIRMLPNDDATLLENLGLAEFAQGVSGYMRRYAEVYAPTCNIQGLTAGYQGPGSKTILPHEASAKLDFRLVPNQDPDEILDQLREHLIAGGFEDITVTPLEGSLFPARTNPATPFVVLSMTVAAEAAGRPPIVFPSSPGSGPMYSFTNGLGLPVVGMGCAYPGSAIHAPDEHLRLSDFWAGTRLAALLIERMAAMDFAAAARLKAEYDIRQKRIAQVEAGEEPTEPNPFADLDTGLPAIDMSGLEAAMAGDFSIADLPAAPPAAPAKKGRTRKAKK